MLSAICSRQTNPDLLGIGVRLGVYIQYFTGLLQMYSHEDRVSVFRQSMIFSISYGIALLWLLIEHKLDSYNVLPALMLGRMIVFVGTLALTAEPKKKRIAVDFLVDLLYAAIAIWFWCYGYQRPTFFDCGPVYAAFFGYPVEAFGWYRYFEILVAGCLLPIAVTYSFFLYLVSEAKKRVAQTSADYYNDILKWWEYIKVCRFLLAWLLFPFLFATVELLMIYNSLTTDFNHLKSIGQLLPFLTSISSLIQVLSMKASTSAHPPQTIERIYIQPTRPRNFALGW